MRWRAPRRFSCDTARERNPATIQQLQTELRNLQRRLGITFIYVTHDQEEALVLSGRIAVMREGRIEQLGEARTLCEHPRTRFVSQFLGSCSLIDARLKGRTPDGFVARTSVGDLLVTASAPGRESFTLAIRPEKVRPCSASMGVPAGGNRVRARVEQRLYVGSETHYELRAGEQWLRMESMNAESGALEFVPGQEAVVELPPAALIVLDD